MQQCQQLQRTVVRDILESISVGDIVNIANQGRDMNNQWQSTIARHQTGSIFKRTSQLVLIFPVIVSSSLKMETAILISKAIERKCVNLLQVLFSTLDLMKYKDSQDLFDYVKRVHTNLDTGGDSFTLDDFINTMDTQIPRNESMVINKEAYDLVMESLRGINDAAKDFLNEDSVNDYSVTHTMYGNTYVTLEASGGGKGKGGSKNSPPPKSTLPSVNDGKMTKANELTPTLMTVNYKTSIDGSIVERSGVIGVKAKMYPVESMEIMGRLSRKYNDANTLFSLIRCSTKEKSFLKDFVLAFDRLKNDAINIAKGSVNTKLFRTLEKRANRYNSVLMRHGDASPITTLVISQEEVEYLKKYSNLDVENRHSALKIFNGFNLLGLVIADNSIEVAKFLFDDDSGMYESVTYSSLAKENDHGDYKKILNLLTKAR